MPEVETAARRLHVAADLALHVGDDHGGTFAHLGNGASGLVLDVDDPSVLRRIMPGRRLTVGLPPWVPDGLVAGMSLRVCSAGHDLARVSLDPGGRVRVRPTPTGLVVAAKHALAARRRLVGAVAIAGAGVTSILVSRHIRSNRGTP